MEEIKKALENEVAEVKELFKINAFIKTFRLDLQKLLDNMHQETLKELKTEFARVESILVSKISEMNNLIDAMNEESLQMRKTKGNHAHEFVSIKLPEKAMAKAEDMANEQKKKEAGNFQLHC